MTVDDLLVIVRLATTKGEVTWHLAQSLEGSERNRRAFSKEIQRSLLPWIASFKQAGSARRKTQTITEAQFIYNHLQRAVWLSWLAEAAGTSEPVLRAAAEDVLRSGKNTASQCAAFRRAVPWQDIERGLRANIVRAK